MNNLRRTAKENGMLWYQKLQLISTKKCNEINNHIKVKTIRPKV